MDGKKKHILKEKKNVMQLQNLIYIFSVSVFSITYVQCAASVADPGYASFLSCIHGNTTSCISPNKLYLNETHFSDQFKHLSKCLTGDLFGCHEWKSGQSENEKAYIGKAKEYIEKAKAHKINVLGALISSVKDKIAPSTKILSLYMNLSSADVAASSSSSTALTRRDGKLKSLVAKIKNGLDEVVIYVKIFLLLPIEIPALMWAISQSSSNGNCIYNDAGSSCKPFCWNVCF